MKIVIVGGGKVGEYLCQELSAEGNDIVLIERNPKRLEYLITKSDITGIVGNGASYEVQMEAGTQNCDIFIAVSQKDEINLIASLIARKLGAKHTILRVRNQEYSEHLGFMRDSFGLTMMINPEQETAKMIDQLISYPSALNVERFVNGRVNMVELILRNGNPAIGISLNDFRQKYRKLLVAIVLRDGEAFIPFGDTVLKEQDHIFVTGNKKELDAFYKAAGVFKEKIRSLLIIGGGRISYYLLRLLGRTHLHIKVIEQDMEQAMELHNAFPHAVVINGDGTDPEFLDEERLETYDSFVSLTGVDEENVMNSLYASSKGVKKIITKINRTPLLKLSDALGLESIITPKEIIANEIIRFVRSLQSSESSNFEAMYRLANNQVEAIQFKVTSHSRMLKIPLKDLQLKPNNLIAYIIRGAKLIIPDGNDYVVEGDHVIVVTSRQLIDDIDDILQ